MDLNKIENKFNAMVVITNKLNTSLESLRKKTINLSITSHNLEGVSNSEKINSELAALVVISKNFKDDVESLEEMVNTVNIMAVDIKKILNEEKTTN